MKVKITRRAEKRIEIVDRFWRKNRLEAPDLVKEELATAERYGSRRSPERDFRRYPERS